MFIIIIVICMMKVIFFIFQSYVLTQVVTYLSPALLYMYGKWFLSPEFINKLFFRGSILGITFVTTFLLRSYGRSINPKYITFYQDLINAKTEYSTDNKVCNINALDYLNFLKYLLYFNN